MPCMSETGYESMQNVILWVLFIIIIMALAALPILAEIFDVPF